MQEVRRSRYHREPAQTQIVKASLGRTGRRGYPLCRSCGDDIAPVEHHRFLPGRDAVAKANHVPFGPRRPRSRRRVRCVVGRSQFPCGVSHTNACKAFSPPPAVTSPSSWSRTRTTCAAGWPASTHRRGDGIALDDRSCKLLQQFSGEKPYNWRNVEMRYQRIVRQRFSDALRR